MYTLFGYKGSGSAAIEAALTMAGLPHALVEAASWDPQSQVEALRAVNPLLQVPTLQLPDGSVLTESAAILIHLGLAHPASGLLPADEARRAQAIRGLVFIAANCYAAISIGDFPARWCADCDEATADRIRAGTRARLHAHWELFADSFPGFDGEAPGGLELLAAVVSRWSGTRNHLAAQRPAFAARLAQVDADARVAPVFARHWGG